MQILNAKKEYMPQIKDLWEKIFDDGTEGFSEFLFSVTDLEDIYIVIEDEKVVSMLIAVTEVVYKDKKGFYLYSACTEPDYRNRKFMQKLVDFACEDQKTKGREFCILEPATDSLFDFYQKIGFDNILSLKKCDYTIKRNLWRKAEFDIVTAARFKTVRDKFYKGNILHYTPKSYEKYAQYLYTFGGSTAETDKAYAVYYIENDVIKVSELLSETSFDAVYLLQAIREKEGCEKAEIYIPENSDLYLGDVSTVKRYSVKGLKNEFYANLMFE